MGQLQQAGADKQESERDIKFKETLANLKRTFPGGMCHHVVIWPHGMTIPHQQSRGA